MEKLDFPIQIIVHGQFKPDAPEIERLDNLENNQDALDATMDAEAENRYIVDIRNLIPDAFFSIKKKGSSQFKYLDSTKEKFEYKVLYIFRVYGDHIIQNYEGIFNIIKNDLEKTDYYATTHDRLFNDDDDIYADESYIEFNTEIKADTTLETKSNIQARTAERVLLGKKNLPVNIIGEIARFVGTKRPMNANRSRPLIPQLSNESLAEAAIIRPEEPKRPWYKRILGLRGGKRKTLRKRNNRRKPRKTRKPRSRRSPTI